jgi:DNA mismatch endonuclease (patch repair protein)
LTLAIKPERPTSQRSAIMRAVPRKNSRAEVKVRRVAHRMGLRFRLYRSDLPGSPDIVFPKHRAILFVHGCFWHRHEGCRKTTTPAANAGFWSDKFQTNVARDARDIQKLRVLGWRVAVVWECQTKDDDLLEKKLRELLELPHTRNAP